MTGDPPVSAGRCGATESQGAEDELVARASTDATAFGELYERYRTTIRAFVRSRVHHPDDAEDITSEVFLRALGALPRYQLRGRPVRSWLVQIAANAVVDHHRGRRGRTGWGELRDGVAAGGCPPDELVVRADTLARVWVVVDQLAARQRRAIRLRLEQDLPLRDIAVRMGTTEGAVKLLLWRGRVGVRRRLGVTSWREIDHAA